MVPLKGGETIVIYGRAGVRTHDPWIGSQTRLAADIASKLGNLTVFQAQEKQFHSCGSCLINLLVITEKPAE